MSEQLCEGRLSGADEADDILLALERLIERATSPVVRLCLEEAQAGTIEIGGRVVAEISRPVL